MKTLNFNIDKKSFIKFRYFSSAFILALSLSSCTPTTITEAQQTSSNQLNSDANSTEDFSAVRGFSLSSLPEGSFSKQTSPRGDWTIHIPDDEDETAFFLVEESTHLIYSYDLSAMLVRVVFNSSETDAAFFFENEPEFYSFQVIDLEKQEVVLNQSIFNDPSWESRLGIKEKTMYMENPRSWTEDHLLLVDILFDYYDGYRARGQYTYNFITGKIENFTTEGTQIETEIKRMRDALKNVTLNDLNSDKIMDMDEWDGISFPLIAEIPEKDIFLYGFHSELYKGVVLRYQDTIQTFEWDYIVRDTLPEMKLYDIDSDGMDEIIIITHVGAGTGVSVHELHILELGENDQFRDVMFEEQDYISQLYAKVHYEYDSSVQILHVTAEEQTYDIPVKDLLFDEEEVPEPFIFRPDYSSIAIFEFDNKIHLLVSPSAYINGTFRFFLDIAAEVEYDGKEFTLKNFTFES